MAETIEALPVPRVAGDPRQPRQHFDAGELADLAASIDRDGLQQPIRVRPRDRGFSVIMGERRLRAVRLLGWETIPAIVVEGMDDATAFVLATAENVARANLNPMDEARALVRMRDEYGMALEEIEARVGLSHGNAAWRMALVDLREDLQHMVARAQLTPTAGYYISKLNLNHQAKAVRAITARPMNTNEVLAMVNVLLDREAKPEGWFPDTARSSEEIKAAAAWTLGLEKAYAALHAIEALPDGWLGAAVSTDVDTAEQRVGQMIRAWERVKVALRQRRVELQLERMVPDDE
jgi:ParB family chromosome partitioning protein